MKITNLDDCCVLKWRLTDACNYKCEYCIRRPIADRYSRRPHGIGKVEDIVKVAEQLESQNGKPVKVDLIGGEPTVLSEFVDIVQELTDAPSVFKVNITSNFSKPVDWWLSLPHLEKITATMSYHPTQTEESVKDFVARAAQLKDRLLYVKCETVQTKESTHIDEFVSECEKAGLDYMVEGNLFDDKLKFKKLVSKATPRYEVEFDDGHKETFDTRNSFLKLHGENGCVIDTSKMMCTRDVDYVYVEYDRVATCKGGQPLEGYKIEKKPHLCWRNRMPAYAGNVRCTLCGNMSIYSVEGETV